MKQNDFRDFEAALARQNLPDTFRVLLYDSVSQLLGQQLGGGVVNWIMRESTWDTRSYNPRKVAAFTTGEKLMHLLWHDLETRLTLKLSSLFQKITSPSQGAVLCFFGGAALNVIVRYRRAAGGAVSLQPITAVENPHGVFELPGLFAAASPEQRSSLKAAALSVDKLLFQRGVLIHVDRQREDVFGPTIDTVLLAEILGERLEALPQDVHMLALEIGPGNGLLCSILGISRKVDALYAIDLNPSAATCTLKNLGVNDIEIGAMTPALCVRAERFRPSEIAQPVDLIVCNPPYIPEPTGKDPVGHNGHHLAVSGLELCKDLLSSLDSILTPRGELLLMTSSLSSAAVQSLIPDGFMIRPAYADQGYRVPLDVDAVWQSPTWRDQLLQTGLIEADMESNLWHYLRPVWVFRQGKS